MGGLALQSKVGVVCLSEKAAGSLVGDAVGSFVLFVILFASVTSNSRFVAFVLYLPWMDRMFSRGSLG